MNYAAANQLLNTHIGAVIRTVSYDGNGNRTGEDTLGALTTWTWDEDNRMTAQQNANGTRPLI